MGAVQRWMFSACSSSDARSVPKRRGRNSVVQAIGYGIAGQGRGVTTLLHKRSVCINIEHNPNMPEIGAKA
ncbi:hypothetical protein, partial [Devosia sp.]|uniref:hypothetical protein n=1 Tax=Devosia sp. TaxID=1871048 RepID=UPI002FC9300E